MKKIYLILSVFVAYLTPGISQTVTVSNHQPLIGDSYSRIQVDSTGDNSLAAITGTNAVWNHTGINSRTLTVVNTYTNRTAVASGSLYPSAAILKQNGPENAFYVTSPTDLKFWGGNVVIMGLTADFVFSTGVTQATYPMNYGDFTNTSSFTGTVISSTFGTGSISGGTASVVYDGKGTLNLPGRSFSNVIRIKTRTAFSFTLLVAGSITFENYDYYDLSKSKHPLFSVSASTIVTTSPSIQYYSYINKDYLQVGINESTKELSSLNVFPNPVKNNFTLSFNNENAVPASCQIINALGQTVRTENFKPENGEVKYKIETAGIEAGIYFVKVMAGNAVSVRKITIE